MNIQQLAIASSVLLATSVTGATEQAAGITANSLGLGATYSRVLIDGSHNGEQLQLRTSYVGADFENEDDMEISGIDYELDLETQALQLGVDWFPFNGRYAKSVFISGGLAYAKADVSGQSEIYQLYNVGGQLVTPNDGVVLTTDIEYEGVAPYLSVGWGNRLRSDRNWYLQTELGITAPFEDPEVSLTAADPNSVLTAEQIAAERADIEDDVSGIGVFGSVSVTYRF